MPCVCTQGEDQGVNQKGKVVVQLPRNSLFALDILAQGDSCGAPMLKSSVTIKEFKDQVNIIFQRRYLVDSVSMGWD